MALVFLDLADLTEVELETWRRLRAQNPSLDSPYFDPAFASAVRASGSDVCVAVDGRGPALTMLLACQRHRSVLRPVGWPGADFQGAVLAPGTAFDPRDLLIDGVRSFEFDHWLPSTPALESWVESRAVSPYVDVTDGLEGYLARASRSGRDNFAQARRRTARAERDHGPVRFVAESTSTDALEWLVERKRAQYAATGARDYFAREERRILLARLLDSSAPGCSGILSTLHVGDALVAAHFGIRSEGVLHWWFPVYDPQWSRLAPGWILLRELTMVAPELGIVRIDLGRGDDEYKRRARTGEVEVAAGAVSGSPAARTLHRTRQAASAAAKSSPMAPLLRRAVHAARARGARTGV